ncbi:hypothetical protein DRO56_02915 [Candidatus Bathyarchaeota archaeon]|nr:MAG: hypothetical protein DRO56_02915 [Candidatus Bathyarchaeota archaeon]
MEFKLVPTDRIRPNPFQPREAFPKEEIEELAESIKGIGLVQPILVRKNGEIYEIIAGERRWRAAQFAGLKEIPVIVREADDIETRELSLVENWHRVALQPIEAERFITKLYKEGVRAGKYKSINDMAKKIGIPERTLKDLITAYKERIELGLSPEITYTDINVTRVLREQPELRRQVLELRKEGKLTKEELREFSKIIKEVSTPVRKALLELKIKPEEAKIIDTELPTIEEKERVIEIIKREKLMGRSPSLIDIARIIEERKSKKEMIVKEGTIYTIGEFDCPHCKRHCIIYCDGKRHWVE